MPRVRTAKTLAERIELQYFTRLDGFRRWRLLLSIALPLLAGGWLIMELIAGNQRVYSSGPMSASHAVFGKNCALCHLRAVSFSAKVEDRACLACHNAPVHDPRQTYTPACSSCHLEHKGKAKLAATTDFACTRCHGDLQVKDGELKVYPHLSTFDRVRLPLLAIVSPSAREHPEFRAKREGQNDPGTIKLNHQVHLQPTIRGPSGAAQMQCEDCHRPTGVNDPWPYSVASVQPASQQPILVLTSEAQQRKRRSFEAGTGAYMAAIKYVNQCAACHVLQFDPLIAQPAPHDKPDVVRAFIVRKLTEYASANPQVIRQSTAISEQELELMEPARNILSPLRSVAPSAPSARVSPTPPISAADWVSARAAVAERLLWLKNCSKCHAQTVEAGDKLPTSVKAVIPTRWYASAEFDHQAHRMMTCISCHAGSQSSRLTSEVNLPGIDLCRSCHKARGAFENAANGQCFECHSYHDWRKETRIKGTMNLSTLVGRGH